MKNKEDISLKEDIQKQFIENDVAIKDTKICIPKNYLKQVSPKH